MGFLKNIMLLENLKLMFFKIKKKENFDNYSDNAINDFFDPTKRSTTGGDADTENSKLIELHASLHKNCAAFI